MIFFCGLVQCANIISVTPLSSLSIIVHSDVVLLVYPLVVQRRICHRRSHKYSYVLDHRYFYGFPFHFPYLIHVVRCQYHCIPCLLDFYCCAALMFDDLIFNPSSTVISGSIEIWLALRLDMIHSLSIQLMQKCAASVVLIPAEGAVNTIPDKGCDWAIQSRHASIFIFHVMSIQPEFNLLIEQCCEEQ